MDVFIDTLWFLYNNFFEKLLSCALIVIGLISMSDVSAKNSEESKSVKRVFRALLRNEPGGKEIQPKRDPLPKMASRVGVAVFRVSV